jgi:hypothetical protein
MDEAENGPSVRLAILQINSTFPEDLSNLTSLLLPPDPMPANAPFSLIVPPKNERFPTNERPVKEPVRLPIPEPDEELLAVTFPL